jgi:hypothetical protein
MSIRKTILLVSVALSAIAVTAPAYATAAEWAHEGKSLEKDVTLTLQGNVGFEAKSLNSEFVCAVHTTMDLIKTSATGQVKTFEITTDLCAGTGILAGCEVVKDTMKGLAWTSHAAYPVVTITDVTADFEFKPIPGQNCAITTVPVSVPKMTATPNNAAAIKSVSLSGEGTGFGGVKLQTFGELTVQGAASGTYGVKP